MPRRAHMCPKRPCKIRFASPCRLAILRLIGQPASPRRMATVIALIVRQPLLLNSDVGFGAERPIDSTSQVSSIGGVSVSFVRVARTAKMGTRCGASSANAETAPATVSGKFAPQMPLKVSPLRHREGWRERQSRESGDLPAQAAHLPCVGYGRAETRSGGCMSTGGATTSVVQVVVPGAEPFSRAELFDVWSETAHKQLHAHRKRHADRTVTYP
jgi:hypothetical protein